MLDSARSWKAEPKSDAANVRGPESLQKKNTNSLRTENYELREAKRTILPIKPVHELNIFEKKIGETYDTDKFPPSDLAYNAGRPVAFMHL